MVVVGVWILHFQFWDTTIHFFPWLHQCFGQHWHNTYHVSTVTASLDRWFALALVGVGKTSLVTQYVKGHFLSAPTTIGASFMVKNVYVARNYCHLKNWMLLCFVLSVPSLSRVQLQIEGIGWCIYNYRLLFN